MLDPAFGEGYSRECLALGYGSEIATRFQPGTLSMPVQFSDVHGPSRRPRRVPAASIVGTLMAALVLGIVSSSRALPAAEPAAASISSDQLEFFEKKVRRC